MAVEPQICHPIQPELASAGLLLITPDVLAANDHDGRSLDAAFQAASADAKAQFRDCSDSGATALH
jgi:hypothetical protein